MRPKDKVVIITGNTSGIGRARWNGARKKGRACWCMAAIGRMARRSPLASAAMHCRLGQPADWPQHVPLDFALSVRLIQPEEIAAAAISWLRNESGPISGSVVELEQFYPIGRNPSKI